MQTFPARVGVIKLNVCVLVGCLEREWSRSFIVYLHTKMKVRDEKMNRVEHKINWTNRHTHNSCMYSHIISLYNAHIWSDMAQDAYIYTK